MPSKSAKSFLKKSATFALLAGGVGAMTYYSLRLARLDPFSSYKASNDESGRLAFTLSKVRITHYRGAKLITQADVDRVEVLKDRQNMHLIGVTNGLYRGEEGEVQFSGKTAEWNAGLKRLDVTSGAHVQNADFNLDVPHFAFDSRKSHLDVVGALKGKLGGGDVVAVNLSYNTKTRDWNTGETKWKGPFALMPQDDGPPKRELWQVNGKSVSSVKGILTYTKGYAESDDTIVTADTVEQNKKTKVITATGHVFYYSGKANMSCDKAVIYTEEKRAVLTGTVNMIVKPKDSETKPKVEEIPPFRPMVPDAVVETRPAAPPAGEDDDPTRSTKNLRKFPMYLLADKIEYFYKKGSRHGIATGSPQAYQNLPENRWRRVWTHEAHYDAEAETLEMQSLEGKEDTRMRDSIGDDMTASWIKLSTVEDDDKMDARDPKGKVYNDDQNQDGAPTKPPPNFERALHAPPLPNVTPRTNTTPTGKGLQGPIGGAIWQNAKNPFKVKRPQASVATSWFPWVHQVVAKKQVVKKKTTAKKPATKTKSSLTLI